MPHTDAASQDTCHGSHDPCHGNHIMNRHVNGSARSALMMSDIVRTCTDAHRVAAAIRKRDMARGVHAAAGAPDATCPRLGWSASLSDGSVSLLSVSA